MVLSGYCMMIAMNSVPLCKGITLCSGGARGIDRPDRPASGRSGTGGREDTRIIHGAVGVVGYQLTPLDLCLERVATPVAEAVHSAIAAHIEQRHKDKDFQPRLRASLQRNQRILEQLAD